MLYGSTRPKHLLKHTYRNPICEGEQWSKMAWPPEHRFAGCRDKCFSKVKCTRAKVFGDQCCDWGSISFGTFPLLHNSGYGKRIFQNNSVECRQLMSAKYKTMCAIRVSRWAASPARPSSVRAYLSTGDRTWVFVSAAKNMIHRIWRAVQTRLAEIRKYHTLFCDL